MQIRQKLSFFLAVLFSLPASAAPLPLSPKDVADLILKQSFRKQEIELQAGQDQFVLAQVEQNYDFQILAETGYQDSKFESPSQSYLLQNQSLLTSVSLMKPFKTGTSLSVVLSGTTDQPDYDSTAPTPASDLSNNFMGIVLKQNLWKNFFGEADRADIRSAQASVQASKINRSIQMQQLVMEANRAYWSAYVAQETFQEARNSRDRYAKLVDSIQRKTGFGYSGPGELAQAQAELENREQNVKTQSAAYLAALEDLITLLRLPPETEIKFTGVNNLPLPPPMQNQIAVENLRPLKASRLKLQAAEDSLVSTRSKASPDVSLVGRYYQQGLDSGLSEANQEMLSGQNPRYYVGIEVRHTFGSGFQDESIRNKRLARDLAETQLQRQKLELKDQESDIRRRLQSTHAIVQSAKTQNQLREKAVQQLQRSYQQGRTDIAILIDALNKYFDSQVAVTRALGNYQMTLIEWDAFRDELIKDQNVEVKPVATPN